MFKSLNNLILKRSQIVYFKIESLSSANEATIQTKLQNFRTKESDPQKHNIKNLGQFYNIPETEKEHLFLHGGLTREFEKQIKTFNETSIMVRQPALDVINCLKNYDYAKPNVRFVLYGDRGTGKSTSLAHIIHYANKAGFLIFHISWIKDLLSKCKESSNSETDEGFIDTNIDVVPILLHFKQQNSHLLTNSELVTSQDYAWSKRETTPKGSHLNELIDHGINRIKYASNCLVILAEEIKILAAAGKCKAFVAIDGFNYLFDPKTRIKTEKREIVHPHKLTITKAFLSLTRFDWKNAVTVLTVDSIGYEIGERQDLPRCLLGKEGFNHLDPFVPVHVSNYDSKEFLSCMNYYRDRKWVTAYPGIDEELSFVSNNNPYELMKRTAPL